jgi:hypothetical protein
VGRRNDDGVWLGLIEEPPQLLHARARDGRHVVVDSDPSMRRNRSED